MTQHRFQCSNRDFNFFIFSVLTITAAYEDAMLIFSECLPKIGDVGATLANITFSDGLSLFTLSRLPCFELY